MRSNLSRALVSLVATVLLTLATGGCQQHGADSTPAARTAATQPEEHAERPLEETFTAPGDPQPLPVPDTSSMQAEMQAAELARRERELARHEAELQQRETELAARRRAQARAARTAAPEPEPEPGPIETAEADLGAPSGEPAPLPPVDQAPPPRITHRVTVPASTPLELALDGGVSSATAQVGDRVVARLDAPVHAGGALAIPAGSAVYGTVTDVQALRRIGGQARLALRFDELELPDGTRVPIDAGFAAAGHNESNRDAATIGGAAAGGAILGRVLDGRHKTRSATIGAAVGAAVGTIIASRTRGSEIDLGPDTVLEVELERDVRLTVQD